jgi:hypothetical protein
MNGDIIQPLEPAIDHRWDARDRLWIKHTTAHNPKPPGPLSDQNIAIRQEGKRPWPLQTIDRHNADFVLKRLQHLG